MITDLDKKIKELPRFLTHFNDAQNPLQTVQKIIRQIDGDIDQTGQSRMKETGPEVSLAYRTYQFLHEHQIAGHMDNGSTDDPNTITESYVFDHDIDPSLILFYTPTPYNDTFKSPAEALSSTQLVGMNKGTQQYLSEHYLVHKRQRTVLNLVDRGGHFFSAYVDLKSRWYNANRDERDQYNKLVNEDSPFEGRDLEQQGSVSVKQTDEFSAQNRGSTVLYRTWSNMWRLGNLQSFAQGKRQNAPPVWSYTAGYLEGDHDVVRDRARNVLTMLKNKGVDQERRGWGLDLFEKEEAVIDHVLSYV